MLSLRVSGSFRNRFYSCAGPLHLSILLNYLNSPENKAASTFHRQMKGREFSLSFESQRSTESSIRTVSSSVCDFRLIWETERGALIHSICPYGLIQFHSARTDGTHKWVSRGRENHFWLAQLAGFVLASGKPLPEPKPGRRKKTNRREVSLFLYGKWYRKKERA